MVMVQFCRFVSDPKAARQVAEISQKSACPRQISPIGVEVSPPAASLNDNRIKVRFDQRSDTNGFHRERSSDGMLYTTPK
jgi:hypothetical protein